MTNNASKTHLSTDQELNDLLSDLTNYGTLTQHVDVLLDGIRIISCTPSADDPEFPHYAHEYISNFVCSSCDLILWLMKVHDRVS